MNIDGVPTVGEIINVGVLKKLAFELRAGAPRPLRAFDVYVGVPVAVACKPFPDLSFQVVTVVPEKTILLLSAPSNHSCKPGIDWGENPHVFLSDAAADVTSAIFLSKLEQNISRNCHSVGSRYGHYDRGIVGGCHNHRSRKIDVVADRHAQVRSGGIAQSPEQSSSRREGCWHRERTESGGGNEEVIPRRCGGQG